MPPIKRFAVNVEFVERVNVAMINGDEPIRSVRFDSKKPARVRAIIANTKQTESEMRNKFAEALQALAVTA